MHQILFWISLFLILSGVIFISVFAPVATEIRHTNVGLYISLIVLFALFIVFGLILMRYAFIHHLPISWNNFMGNCHSLKKSSRLVEN